MATGSTQHESAVGSDGLDEFGYEQELTRRLGSFQMFAISFAFISVAVGIFATYDVILQGSGPVGMWMWIVVAVGQILVALVFAQFAARIPLSGSAYQWASRLANPRIGWWFGWVSYLYLGLSVVALDNALASQALMPLLGIDADEGTARLTTLAVMLLQAVIAVVSTRLVAGLNSTAVGVELGIVALLSIVLVVVAAITGDGSIDNLTSRGIAQHAPDYFALGGPLVLSMLVGLATLVGFDAAANLAEEAKDPYRSVPRAMIGSVVAASVLGLVFLMALTVSIDDVGRVSQSDSPVATIMRDQLGSVTEKVFLVAIVFAFFAAGMVVMATAARLIFAMARDERFPASRLMRKVDPRTQTPVPATILILAGGVLLMIGLPGDALLQLITAGTTLVVLFYGATVVLYLVVRKQLGRKEGAFSLGRFEVPVAIAALVWLLIALGVVTLPGGSLTPDLIVIGLIVLGGVFFLGISLTNRQALESEPGD